VFRKVADGPDAGAGCHGSLALAAPSTRPGRRKGVDGTWTRPLWFPATFEVALGRKT
jgi:hypothetical protein